MALTRSFGLPAVCGAIALGLLATIPWLGLPPFYESFFFILLEWITLCTAWTILSGYSGYFNFGQAAFFGIGVYTGAVLAGQYGVPFLWTIPAAALISAAVGTGVGWIVFRLDRLRGELFALLTLAVAFVVSTIILNTPFDGGAGVLMSGVTVPHFGRTQSGTIYLLGLVIAAGTLATAYVTYHSFFGRGLFAIHDDEDAAEVKGVPTFRYKLMALALSCGLSGMIGAVHALYVGYVTVGDTFSLVIPLYVVLMCLLGGMRHWFGPTIGAVIIAVALHIFSTSGDPILGRAIVAFGLIVAIIVLPDGIAPALAALRKAWWPRRSVRVEAASTELSAASPVQAYGAEITDVSKSFGGVRALRNVTLTIQPGEILGLVGPNGSGKSTLINVITGHYRLDSGSIVVGGQSVGHLPAHQIARTGIARTYQTPRLFAHMTVFENVALCASFGSPDGASTTTADILHWLEFAGLADKADALPADLNLHQRKFLELARAMVVRPRLLLLDEVLSGLNPAEISSALDLIRQIRAQNTTVVFVEHVMRAVVEVSDRVAVLNEGKLIAIGEPRETMQNAEVVNVYIGKAFAAA